MYHMQVVTANRATIYNAMPVEEELSGRRWHAWYYLWRLSTLHPLHENFIMYWRLVWQFREHLYWRVA